jgi:hypothetical protein
LKANKVNLFVSSVLCVFWYHSPNVLDTLHICNISWLRVNGFESRVLIFLFDSEIALRKVGFQYLAVFCG